jgi:hypothetical protein
MILVIIISELREILDILYYNIIEISSDERHFGNPVSIY